MYTTAQLVVDHYRRRNILQCSNNNKINYYTAGLISHSTGHARPSIRPSVCLILAPNSKTKNVEKAKIGVNVPRDRRSGGVNFEFKMSKVKVKVTGRQKPPENDAYLVQLVLTCGRQINSRQLGPPHTRRNQLDGRMACRHEA